MRAVIALKADREWARKYLKRYAEAGCEKRLDEVLIDVMLHERRLRNIEITCPSCDQARMKKANSKHKRRPHEFHPLGEFLRMKRKDLGLTQREVAQLTGDMYRGVRTVEACTITDWERGNVLPRNPHLERLAEALQVDVKLLTQLRELDELYRQRRTK